MEAEASAIRILLIDGHSLFRQAVGGALEEERDLHVVGESHDVASALEDVDRTRPDVALLDADVLRVDLLRVLRDVKTSAPQCRTLVLTSEQDVGMLVEMLEAGASGYVTKDATVAQLIDATRSVSRGDVVIPPRMVGALLNVLVHQRGRRDESQEQLARLTKREREVLALLAEGSDKDAIARLLVISPQTARTHVQNILSKLGLHSRLEAAAFARKQPILQELIDSGR